MEVESLKEAVKIIPVAEMAAHSYRYRTFDEQISDCPGLERIQFKFRIKHLASLKASRSRSADDSELAIEFQQ